MPYTANNYKETMKFFGRDDEKEYHETDVEITNLFEE